MNRLTGNMPRPWDSYRVTLATAVALLPAVAVFIARHFPAIVAPMLLALGLGLAWPLLLRLMHFTKNMVAIQAMSLCLAMNRMRQVP